MSEKGPRSKRALVLTSVASMVDQFLMPSVELLQSMGYEVDVAANFDDPGTITPERAEALRVRLLGMGVTVHQIGVPRSLDPRKLIAAYDEIRTLAKEGLYSLVHCHSPFGGALCRLAFRSERSVGTKVIYTAHGFHFYKGAPLKNWLLYYSAERMLAHWTDVLITINREDFERAQTFAAKRVEYVPGVGIDVASFTPSSGRRSASRASLSIPPEGILLLSVGEVNDNKNHVAVIRALADMKVDDVWYVVCGEGPLIETNRTVAEELGVGERVIFAGYRQNVRDFYQCADAFVFPSKREGLPVALMEAMASSLPVICSDIRGSSDLVADGVNGLVFDLEDRSTLIRAIERLSSDRKLMATLGRRAHESIGAFDVTKVRRDLERIYRETLRRDRLETQTEDGLLPFVDAGTHGNVGRTLH